MRRPIKVLALSHSAVVPAYRAKFRRLAARRGWDLHLALPHQWPEGGSPVAAPAPGREGKLQVHVLPCRLAGHVGFATLKGLGRLARDLRPDLLYVEEEPYSLAALAALRLDLPLVFYTWENMDRRYKPPLNWVRRRVLAQAQGAVAGNREGAQLLRGWGYKGPLLEQPQYGVDCKHFKPAAKIKRPFAVGYLGRLVPEKGVDLLLQAGVRALIGGQGPEEARLKALGTGAEFLGFVPFAKRLSFYRRIDALVLPSRSAADWKEQFGRVLAEAMACGLPCVGSDSGAIPEVMGKGGLVFPEGDAQALAERLKRLAVSPALRQSLGRAGRKRAVEHFDEAVLTEDLGRFLEAVAHAR